MSTSSILAWFEKRRKTKTLETAKNQITKSIETGLEQGHGGFFRGKEGRR